MHSFYLYKALKAQDWFKPHTQKSDAISHLTYSHLTVFNIVCLNAPFISSYFWIKLFLEFVCGFCILVCTYTMSVPGGCRGQVGSLQQQQVLLHANTLFYL